MKTSQMNTRQLCKDFLRLHKGETLDAIEASQMMDRHWGIRVDWHEMADALVALLQACEVHHAKGGFDRMSRYYIAK